MSTPTGTATPPATAPQVTPEGAGTGTKTPAGTGAPPAAPPPGTPPPPPPAKAGEAPPPPAAAPKTDGTSEVVYDLKMPDGSKLKPEHAEALKAYAKEHGLTPKQAQAQLERESKALADSEEAQKADLAQKGAAWKKATVEHPELGGQNLPRTTKRCAAALTRFDPDGKLKHILEISGIGDLPEVVAYQERIGAALESDRFVSPPTVPQTAEPKKDKDVLYG